MVARSCSLPVDGVSEDSGLPLPPLPHLPVSAGGAEPSSGPPAPRCAAFQVPPTPVEARRRRDYLYAWASWHAFAPEDRVGPLFRSLRAEDRQVARERWMRLQARWERWSEGNASLAEAGEGGPEWEVLDATQRRMGGGLSASLAELAEWAGMELAEVAELLAEVWFTERKRAGRKRRERG